MNIAKQVMGHVGCLVVAATFLFSGHALAAESKIGVIDMKKVLSTSTSGQRAQTLIEEKMKTFQGALKKDENELVAMQKEMEKKGSAWTDAVKQEKAKAFQKKRGELAEKQENANQELKKLREDNVNPILKKLEEIVEKIAKSEGYTIVLPRNVVLYTSDATDISDKITAELNKVMK